MAWWTGKRILNKVNSRKKNNVRLWIERPYLPINQSPANRGRNQNLMFGFGEWQSLPWTTTNVQLRQSTPLSVYLAFFGLLRHSKGRTSRLYSIVDFISCNCNLESLFLTSSLDARSGSSSLLWLPVFIKRLEDWGEGHTNGHWTEESARRILWPAATV